MTFTQLRTFALVAELGSLRAAAAALGVSEPAVSAAVAALRTDLGDPLFRRTGTGIALTPGGRALATRARELVRLADRTRREVGAARRRPAGCGSWRRRPAPSTWPDAVVAAFTRQGAASRGRPDGRVDRVRGGRAGRGRRADIVLGVRPAPADGHRPTSCRSCATPRIVVVAPGPHPPRGVAADLAGRVAHRPGRFRGRAARRTAGRRGTGSADRRTVRRARPRRSPPCGPGRA